MDNYHVKKETKIYEISSTTTSPRMVTPVLNSTVNQFQQQPGPAPQHQYPQFQTQHNHLENHASFGQDRQQFESQNNLVPRTNYTLGDRNDTNSNSAISAALTKLLTQICLLQVH